MDIRGALPESSSKKSGVTPHIFMETGLSSGRTTGSPAAFFPAARDIQGRQRCGGKRPAQTCGCGGLPGKALGGAWGWEEFYNIKKGLHPKNLPAAAFAGWFPDIAKLRKAFPVN